MLSQIKSPLLSQSQLNGFLKLEPLGISKCGAKRWDDVFNLTKRNLFISCVAWLRCSRWWWVETRSLISHRLGGAERERGERVDWLMFIDKLTAGGIMRRLGAATLHAPASRVASTNLREVLQCPLDRLFAALWLFQRWEGPRWALLNFAKICRQL